MRLAVIGLCFVLAGCDITVREPRTDLLTVDTILIARTRRAQLIAEISRINHVLRFTRAAENRIVLEQALNDRTVELERLNVIVFAP